MSQAPHQEKKSLAAGRTASLTKPFKSMQLLEVIAAQAGG
jgi:CheY-like chemotaxis protein